MNDAPLFKPYQILIPISRTATGSGVGVQVTPGENADYQAIAIASLGAVTGSPSSFTAVITVEESATVNGSYTTNTTFATATGTGNIGTLPVKINPAKPFIRATATLAFVAGTTPAVIVDVVLLMKENVATDSNETTLA